MNLTFLYSAQSSSKEVSSHPQGMSDDALILLLPVSTI